MATSEVRVEARIRNNVLWHAVFDRWGSVAECCRDIGMSGSAVGLLLNLTGSPQLRDGQWSTAAVRLAEALHIDEATLFPLRLYNLDQTKAVVEVPLAALPPSSEELRSLLPGPEDAAAAAEMRGKVSDLLETLAPRERSVLRKRFGLDGFEPMTFSEMEHEEGSDALYVTSERIRQIEIKALRKLRHPTRARLIDMEAG